jgi:signal transduction histidine kinase
MGSRILYVDDDRSNLVVFEAAFGDELDVLTAASGPEALELLARHRDVALLLTDQRMPGMSGTQLAEIVHREHPDIVRYLITAYSDLAAAIDAINLGQVHRYLRKPWDPDEMRVHLREGLELHGLRTRIRDLERRLRDVERVYALGVIAASIVHELRNPLSVVMGYVDLARHLGEKLAAAAGPAAVEIADDLQRTLDGTWEAAGRMGDIVRGVELSTRRQVGRARTDVGEVVDLTLRIIINELRHRATVDTDVARGHLVAVSQTQLGQVALNLMINALQAIPEARALEDAHIRIRVHAADARVRLEIADDGKGVPAEMKAKIFDPFFTTKEQGGTGLGLAISKQIVEEAGGTLTVHDTPGGGATFVVELPEVADEEG